MRTESFAFSEVSKYSEFVIFFSLYIGCKKAFPPKKSPNLKVLKIT